MFMLLEKLAPFIHTWIFIFIIHIFVELFLSHNPLLHSLTTKIPRFISSFSLASYYFPVTVMLPDIVLGMCLLPSCYLSSAPDAAPQGQV